jgi:hypothetical protein
MPSPRRPTLDLRALLRLRATWLALLGIGLVALTSTVTAALTLSHALSPTAFAGLVSEAFERDIRVEAVRLELHGRPRLHVEGVTIDGIGAADAAEIELRVRPLLRGEVRLRHVRLESPAIVLRRGPDGAFLPMLPPRGGGGDLGGLPSVETDGGEIRVVQGTKLTAVLRLTSLSLGHFDASRVAPLVLAGNVTGGDGRWHTHPLYLVGDLVQAADGVSFVNGRARAGYVGANWWSGHDARARFAYRDGRIDVRSLDVRGFGGNWHAAGRVTLRGGTRLDLAVWVDGVDFASLLSAADGRGPETDADLGTLRMRWSPLKLPWRGGPRFEEGEGHGLLWVSGGVLPGTSVLGSLVGREAAPTPVESFSADEVTLARGRLASDTVRLVTGDYVLEAGGSVGLDRSVALEGRVNLAGGGAAVLPTFPVTIAGTLPRPNVDAHVSRVPVNGIGAVAGAVQATGSTVVGTVARGLKKVGEVLR